ncbi:MAG: class I SAM-dependent methyltransferase [Flavobacterium sp.]|nr:MAG: class I SAM-dependent methyltransferase [Flavobacterium sp.]
MEADFDIAAAVYDEQFTHSVIGRAQRRQVHHHLEKLLEKQKVSDILEVNCGTGEDALWFATRNLRVTASDISPEMLAEARKKQLNGSIRFCEADLRNISTDFGGREFDLVFSNFGGLNCLSHDEIAAFISNSSKLLRQNGLLILVIMPRNTAWEQLYFRLKGQKANYNRRQRQLSANVNGNQVPVFYYNPLEIVAMAKELSVVEIKPIGLFVPPSYLEPHFKKQPSLIAFLNRLDKVACSSSFAKYADHYLIALQKR